MKIAFFIDSLRAGGKERQLAELVKGLTARRLAECTIVSMSRDNHYFDGTGHAVHYLVRRSRKDLGQFVRFYRFLKDLKPDLIHTWDYMTSVYVVPAAYALKLRLVNGMIRDAPPFGRGFDARLFWGRLSFPFAEAVVANSRAGLAAYGAPRDKSHCIHNGFDFARFGAQSAPARQVQGRETGSPYLIGMVASCTENKDYGTFFKAAELVCRKRQDVSFIAVGEGTDGSVCKGLIPSHIRDRVRLMGKRKDVEAIVGQFDIGVLATTCRHGEGISNAIMEYMAAGKPVVATDAGGTTELVVDSATGFLAPQGDCRTMAHHMLMLLQNRRMAEAMGRAGKERILNVFSLERMVDAYVSLYARLLEPGSCPASGLRPVSPEGELPLVDTMTGQRRQDRP